MSPQGVIGNHQKQRYPGPAAAPAWLEASRPLLQDGAQRTAAAGLPFNWPQMVFPPGEGRVRGPHLCREATGTFPHLSQANVIVETCPCIRNQPPQRSHLAPKTPNPAYLVRAITIAIEPGLLRLPEFCPEGNGLTLAAEPTCSLERPLPSGGEDSAPKIVDSVVWWVPSCFEASESAVFRRPELCLKTAVSRWRCEATSSARCTVSSAGCLLLVHRIGSLLPATA